MKKLYLSRHAKSDWSDFSLSDYQRPLNKRGYRDAPFMAKKLSDRIDNNIQYCLSSGAVRALSTAQYYHDVFGFSKFDTTDRLYHSSVEEILEEISSLSDEYEHVILFGHNPGFGHVYNHFSDDMIGNLPTAGVFCISSTASIWSDIDTTNSKIDFLLFPKMFK